MLITPAWVWLVFVGALALCIIYRIFDLMR